MSETELIFSPRTLKATGGRFRDRLAVRLMWLISLPFCLVRLRGYWRITRPVADVLGARRRIWVQAEDDVRLPADVTDPYWNRLIAPYFVYEPEMHHLLRRLRDKPYLLLDCGANMGYWSSYASSKRYGKRSAVAVEALSSNKALLEATCAQNGGRFTVVHRAISDQDGQHVTLYQPSGHASVSLIHEGGPAVHTEQVTTVTLDTLYEQYNPKKLPVLLKLDVEGVEIQALKGAKNLLSHHPLILYEDHGKDKNSAISEYILKTLKLLVWHMHDDGRLEKIAHLDAVKRIKQDETRGYNFIACSDQSSFMTYLL